MKKRIATSFGIKIIKHAYDSKIIQKFNNSKQLIFLKSFYRDLKKIILLKSLNWLIKAS